jgi:hypothetical protein
MGDQGAGEPGYEAHFQEIDQVRDTATYKGKAKPTIGWNPDEVTDGGD